MRAVDIRWLYLLFGVLVTTTSGCAYTVVEPDNRCPIVPPDVAVVEEAVFGGDASCAVLGRWQDAVGVLLVRYELDGMETVGTCTLSRIQPGIALTAKHCFPESNRFRASVGYGSTSGDASGCARATGDAAIRAVRFHPTADVAIVRYAEVGGAPALPIATATPSYSRSVILAGYGLTEDGTLNARRCTGTQLKDIDSVYVTGSAAGTQGACVGDSGGPLLQFSESGLPELYGVLSAGSATCVGADRYVPLAPLHHWLDAVIGNLSG